MMKNSTSGKDALRAFIERIERLDAEAKDIADMRKEVFGEAKGQGYDVKVMRKLVAERKRNADDVAEEEAILELYRTSLGMAYSVIGSGESDDIV